MSRDINYFMLKHETMNICVHILTLLCLCPIKCILILGGSGVKLDKKIKLNYYRKVKSES